MRLIGGVLLVIGVLCTSPTLLLLFDGVISLRVVACSAVIGVPLIIAGARRLVTPGRF